MSSTNPQAVELNECIGKVNSHVLDLLSERGRNIFFPREGILAQTAEAEGKEINATIGAALEDDGSTMCLPSLASRVSLEPGDVFPYAKSSGKLPMRRKWKEMMYRKNPSLDGAAISLPVVSCALTHGLSMAAYLLADPGKPIIVTDLYWGNYRLILSQAYGIVLDTFRTFSGEGLNIEGLREKLMEGTPGKRIVLLNFPNNPTGYTPTEEEAGRLRDVLVEAADAGNTIAVLVDDAYFGLVYEEGVLTESIFARLADAHRRILAVKFDGPTKEDFVWGFRVGFVTFGVKDGNEELYGALEAKMSGIARGSISNASHVAQSLLLAAYEDKDYENQKKQKRLVLKRRYDKVRSIFAGHPEYGQYFEPLPFNSGYFMCVRLKGIQGEPVRKRMLDAYGSGVIAIGDLLRVAFSSTPLGKLETLLANMYRACRDVSNT